MTKLSLLAVLMLGASMSVSANSNQTHNVDHATEIQMADASQVEQGTNNAVRLKFMSRRGYQNPAVNNKDQYKSDDEWVGATYVDEKESKASKRLNRQFRSKRPYTNYQFD